MNIHCPNTTAMQAAIIQVTTPTSMKAASKHVAHVNVCESKKEREQMVDMAMSIDMHT